MVQRGSDFAIGAHNGSLRVVVLQGGLKYSLLSRLGINPHQPIVKVE